MGGHMRYRDHKEYTAHRANRLDIKKRVNQNTIMATAAQLVPLVLLLLLLLQPAFSASLVEPLDCPTMDLHCHYFDGGHEQGVSAWSWQECGQLCLEDPTCNFWALMGGGVTASPEPRGCFLLPEISDCIYSPGSISGEKGCVAKMI